MLTNRPGGQKTSISFVKEDGELETAHSTYERTGVELTDQPINKQLNLLQPPEILPNINSSVLHPTSTKVASPFAASRGQAASQAKARTAWYNGRMTPEDLKQQIRQITVWKRGEQRAPHKPLLMLYALSRCLDHDSRMIPYAEVDRELKPLLMEFRGCS